MPPTTEYGSPRTWIRRRVLALFTITILSIVIVTRLEAYVEIITWNTYSSMLGRPKMAESEWTEAERKRNELYLEYLHTTESLNKFVSPVRRKRLPDIIGIGAEKCGTGALRWTLKQHPMIRVTEQGEIHFYGRTLDKGLDYYINLMPEVAMYELAMEKSPGYFCKGVIETPKIFSQMVPNAKLILILCDPVNRTLSDFVEATTSHRLPEDEKFEPFISRQLDALAPTITNISHDVKATNEFLFQAMHRDFLTHITTTGLYYYHVTRWFKYYNESNLLIVDGEELITNPGRVFEKVQDFLNIPKLLIPDDFVRGPNGFYCTHMPLVERSENGITLRKNPFRKCLGKGAKGRTRMGNWAHAISNETMKILREFYAPYNEKLFKLLGRTFNWQK